MKTDKLYKYSMVFILFFLFCSGSKDEPQKILARIGERKISVEEFLYRAELTPRPFYCRSNTEKHKIIALNSLIAEKLFAMEECENSDLISRPMFKAYIKGRKEQYMREELFNRITKNSVNLDPSEIRQTFQLAGFVYDVEFYNINKEVAEKIETKLLAEPDSHASIFNAIDLTETVPRKTIKYKDPEHPSIHHVLYSKKLYKGDVVGPLKLQENQYLIMKIKKVSYAPTLSESEILDRKRFVKERLIEKKSIALQNEFVSKIMKGLEIEFVPQTTVKLAELYAMKDLPDNQQDDIIIKKLEKNRTYLDLKDLTDNNILMEAPFFKINNTIWTVVEFRELLSSHPLVFRKPDFTPDEYLEQFKLAVVDLIRDHYITEEAYAQSIDKSKYVKRNVEMWQDSYMAKHHREKYLKSLAQSDGFNKNRMKGIYTYIDEYADSLQKKYSDLIEINMDEFEKIELTKTDLFSVQQFVPYPLTVPAFPQLCVDDKLDYGLRKCLK